MDENVKTIKALIDISPSIYQIPENLGIDTKKHTEIAIFKRRDHICITFATDATIDEIKQILDRDGIKYVTNKPVERISPISSPNDPNPYAISEYFASRLSIPVLQEFNVAFVYHD